MATPRITRSKFGKIVNSVMKNVVTPVQNRLRSFVVGEDKLKSSVDNSDISDISQRNTIHKDIPEVVSKLNLSDTCSTMVSSQNTPDPIKVDSDPGTDYDLIASEQRTSTPQFNVGCSDTDKKNTNGAIKQVKKKKVNKKRGRKSTIGVKQYSRQMTKTHKLQEPNQNQSFLNCNKFIELPNLISKTWSDISEMNNQMKHQTQTIMGFNETLRQLSDHNFLLAEHLNAQSSEIQELKNENKYLRQQLINLKEEKSYLASLEPERQCKKLTLNPGTWNNRFSQENNQIESQQNSVEVKDSSIRSPTRNVQTDEQKQQVILMGGPTIQKLPEIVSKDITISKNSKCDRIQDLSEAMREVTASSVVLHCGTTNTATERAHTSINRIKRLEIIIKNNQHIKNVFVSSLLPRKDNFDFNRRAELVNASLKLICESNNWHYISNDNISLMELDDDGYHLNIDGTAMLADNIRNALRGTSSMQADRHFQGTRQTTIP